jgi:hypothetical protein
MEILYDYLRLLGETRWKPGFPEGPSGGNGMVIMAGGGSGGEAPVPSAASKYDSSAKAKVPGTRQAIGKAVTVGAGMTHAGSALSGAASTVAPIVTNKK